jgi:hypothetical protein
MFNNGELTLSQTSTISFHNGNINLDVVGQIKMLIGGKSREQFLAVHQKIGQRQWSDAQLDSVRFELGEIQKSGDRLQPLSQHSHKARPKSTHFEKQFTRLFCGPH